MNNATHRLRGTSFGRWLQRACVLVAAVVCLSSASARADAQRVVEVTIITAIKATLAEGLVLNRSSTIRKADLEFTEAPGRGYIVRVPVEASELDAQTMVTAIVRAEDGEIAFGPVRAVNSATAIDSFLDLPECASGTSVNLPKPNPAMLDESKMELLQKLIQVRMERRETMRTQLSQLLDERTRESIMRLEERLGLPAVEPLTADLAPALISERMQRLLMVLRNYELKRKRQEQSGKAAAPKAAH